MIQGGDPTGSGMGGPGYKFADEKVVKDYEPGTLAMANADPKSLDVQLDGRLLSISSHQDNRSAHSSSSQHFSSRLLLPGPVDPNTPVQITNENNRVRIRISKPATVTATTRNP